MSTTINGHKIYTIKGDDYVALEDYIKVVNYNNELEQKIKIYERYVDETFLYTYEELQDKVIEKQLIIAKAIEKYEKCKEEDYCTLSLDMYDILRGEDDD